MKRKWRQGTALLLCGAAAVVQSPTLAAADTVLEQPYVSLGADLTETQRAEVLTLLGITEAELAEDTVVTITNQEEHEYLDAYLDASVIGDQALSCALIVGKEDGYGIQVTTQNITYCTISMYQNALVTAGIENADITVAGPEKITGTAALLGVMKAYSEMTGEELSEENIEAATEELVTTSALGDALQDSELASELIAAVKQEIAEKGIEDPESIRSLILSAAEQLGITLTDEQVEEILQLMQKIANLDLDVDQLKEQVQGLYEKLEGMNLQLDSEQVQGFLEQIGAWFGNLWNSISSWLSGLFG